MRRAPHRGWRRGGAQTGSGSVLLVAVLGAAVVLAAGAVTGGRLGLAAARAASAADAAALAGAAAVEDPCAAADPVARAAGAQLLTCAAEASGAVDVLVGVPLPASAAWAGPVTARSRAGPEPLAP